MAQLQAVYAVTVIKPYGSRTLHVFSTKDKANKYLKNILIDYLWDAGEIEDDEPLKALTWDQMRAQQYRTVVHVSDKMFKLMHYDGTYETVRRSYLKLDKRCRSV